jgi:L-threonylcarbamoyladenylate synthase
MTDDQNCPHPDPLMIDRAASILRKGGVVAYPTETSYGLGASISSVAALERIFAIKHRPREKPLLVLVADVSELAGLAAEIPDAAVSLMERFWPGPLTILFPSRPGRPWPLCGDTGKIGVRISAHPWARALVKALGNPITATSANLSGHPSAYLAEDVARQLADPPPDLILDGGVTAGHPPSTIVDASTQPLRLVRKGAIDPRDIPFLGEIEHA